MINQYEIQLRPRSRGFHIITNDILKELHELPNVGLLHIFCKHTSAGICINEAADPDVLHDYELNFNRLVPENLPGLRHTIEGPDDMPAHIKTTLTGHEITIPISKGQLNLGTWQGIYLCEFRNRASGRKLVLTVYS